MHKKCLLCLVLFAIVISFGAMAFAEEDKPTCNTDLTVYSKYVWRGYELSKDSIVIFPSMTVGYKGFDMNVWGDFDTDYEGDNTGNNGTEWWETDWVLTYSNSLDVAGTALNWTLGWIYYDVDGADNEEVFAVLGLDVLLSPEISVWKGIEYGDDSWYYKLALSHSFPLDNGWSIDVGAWGSYMSIEGWAIDGGDYDELHDSTIWAGLNIPVNDWCTITPSINYSFPLSSDAEDVIERESFDFNHVTMSGGDSDWVYGGVNVNISF